MGLKSAVLVELFLPLLVPLLLIAPLLAEGEVATCLGYSDYKWLEFYCKKEENEFCFTIKCNGNGIARQFNGCDTSFGKDRDGVCKRLWQEGCHGLPMIPGPLGCQLCTTNKCNTGELSSGGDWGWDRRRPEVPTTTRRTGKKARTQSMEDSIEETTTTTTEKTTKEITEMISTAGEVDGDENNGTGGPFAVDLLLLIAASLLLWLAQCHSLIW